MATFTENKSMKPVTEAQTAVRGVIQPFVLTESQQIGVKSTRLAFLAKEHIQVKVQRKDNSLCQTEPRAEDEL